MGEVDGLAEAFELSAGDAGRYWVLREAMLRESPWAFASDVETDVAQDPARFARRLSREVHSILAIEGESGELVASAGVMRRPKRKLAHRAEIWGVYVLPAFRGRGLGKRVVRAALETGLSWDGVTSVSLSLSERSAARGVYESLGFRAWGVEPDVLRWEGRSYDEIHMVYLSEAEPRG